MNETELKSLIGFEQSGVPLERSAEGTFHRECSNATSMIAGIETALKQAEEGVVPYSNEARGLLAHELQQRLKGLAE